MIKVMIADDERMVCQLIEFLVQWETLEMQVVARAYNGVEALSAIKEYKPDIVITDIRMPGCDGLELIENAKAISPTLQFIIISGHRHFEYAQKAIKYGVKDYLLKPIQKDELVTTLSRMRRDYLEKTEQLTKEEKLKVYEQNNKNRIRRDFFNEVIFQKKVEKNEVTIPNINNKYMFNFREGMFQIAIIKIDGMHEGSKDDIQYMKDKMNQLIHVHLADDSYELETLTENFLCYLVLNFSEEKVSLRNNLKAILDELLLQKELFENMLKLSMLIQRLILKAKQHWLLTMTQQEKQQAKQC